MTDDEAIERSRMLTLDDLTRLAIAMNGQQRKKHFVEVRAHLQALGATEQEILEALSELGEVLDQELCDGLVRLREWCGPTTRH